MGKVYLDNAATTQMRPEVIEEMVKVATEDYGNASSSHSFGRSAKNVVELSRKSIAHQLNATAREIIFTSGGTEADNFVIFSCVKQLKVARIITSKIEHHAVLHAVQAMKEQFAVQVDYVNVNSSGEIDIMHLAELLSDRKPTLVTLMHVNNEIGTVLNLQEVGSLCRQYNAYFHSDTIQSIGKVPFDLGALPIDFIVASAHKFHGPKGVGFLYIRKGIALTPMFFGGEQEKGLRPGTESVHNIAAMAKALELSYHNLTEESNRIKTLKEYTITALRSNFPEAKINAASGPTFYNLLNVCLPFDAQKTTMILFNLDMMGIAVSRGSACQSGSMRPSHVLAEILSEADIKKPSLRISFSHLNTSADVDYLIEILKTL